MRFNRRRPTSAATSGLAAPRPAWNGHYRPGLILHETLHALGLKHPFEGGETLDVHDDVITTTVMSYSPVAGNREGAMSHYPDEPMPLDIQALQALYGAATSNAADTVYDLARWQENFHIVLDSAGNDTLDARKLATGVDIDLTPGAGSKVGLTVHAFSYHGTGASRTYDHSTYEETLRIDTAAGSRTPWAPAMTTSGGQPAAQPAARRRRQRHVARAWRQ
jgi:serralysin